MAALVVTIMAIITAFDVQPAIGAPGDIFSSPAPVIGSDPPKASELKAGDSSVATQTGALTYSYPVQVPPGRNGMAPQLALSYSSQAPTYGGIAAGWSLAIPEIREDTSQSRLVSRSPQVEQGQADPARDDRFVSSLAGGRPLIAVTEPTSAGVYQTYRAQNDASFARYERMDTGQPFRWRVYTTDGTVMTFGQATRLSLCVNANDQYAPLTGIVDSFGNEVKYEYSGDALLGECRISTITWGQNTNPGVAQSFAQVSFGWSVPPYPPPPSPSAPCTTPTTQPGSFRDYHSVTQDKPPIITGGSKLLTITATAFPPGSPQSPEHTRQITLGYDTFSESCIQSHSPVRLLTSIQESAWGADSPRVDQPAVTFEYGSPTVALTSNVKQSAPWSDIWGIPTRKNNLAWGYRRIDDRWPSLEAMLLDIDGDGLLDRVTSVGASTDTSNPISSCTAKWQRNLGPNASGNIVFSGTFNTIALPRLKWRGTDNEHQVVPGAATAQRGSPSYEGCSLNGQVTAYQNSVPSSNCHPPTVDGSATDPNNHQHYCFDGGTELPHSGLPTSDYRTYLAYRWLDADGDGLIDLVAAVHGDIDAYDIERGNRLNYDSGEPSISGIPGVGTWPACPGQGDRCTDFGSCLKDATSCTNGVCAPLWSVVNQCLVSQAKTGCAQVSFAPPPGGGGNGPTQNRAPYQRCEGLYPWFIYKNQGNGSFATTPIIKYQPVELESQASDSAITGPAVAAENHAIVDFDGDGILDALVRDAINPSISWQVWLGDGTGGFGTKDYVYITRDGTNGGNRISSQGFAPTPMVSSSAGLIDINGDGLQDHWIPSASIFNVAISDGTQHRLYGTGTPTGEIETPANVKPGSDTSYTVTKFSGTNVPLAGWSSAQNRVVDVDNDGRPDVVSFTPSPVVYWNAGGQFSSSSNPYPGINDDGIKRRTEGTQTGDPPGSPETLYWELKGDLIDLDGNGIPESVFFTEAVLNRNTETTQPNTTAPPRLMIAIHNGRGGHAAVTYTSMHDPAATVEQHPELRWTDAFCPTALACPKATSREQWVVQRMTVTDDFPTTLSTTSYVYKNPRHSPDDRGRYAFRGFETVVTTAPSLATTEQTYGYNVDWSGRLTKTIVKPKPTESATDVRSIDKTTWVERELFDGAIKTYHGTVTEHFTCANGQTEATCTAASAAGYTRTISNLSPLGSNTQAGGPKMLWAETTSLLRSGTSAADGDRETLTRYVLNADGTTYRLRPLISTRQHRVGGTMTMFATSAKTWDPTYRVPLTEEVWFDASDANRAITRSEYDITTGNLTRRWKPMQNAANTTYTAFTYDARKLFVATEVNEAGHQFDYTYEYGTGAKLQTDGPNVRACTTTCPPTDPKFPVKEQDKIRIDGLGRPIERWMTTSDDGNIYTLYQVETTSYVDTAAGAVPTSVTNRVRMDVSPTSIWKEEKTEFDGHGRPVKTTMLAQSSAPTDHVTTFRYRNDGTLETVSVPDPTANDATLVSYTYGFDSLGRATSIRRPDATASTDRSGVDIAYDGVTQTTTEVVGATGGQAAVTKTVKDKFGRLIEVHEQIAASPATWAVTQYTYGPDDRVATVVDPQNVTTTLTHDFAGRRTQITRTGGRTWKYTYDKNGNLIAEQVPGSSAPATDPSYTTTIAYDDLDRPVSKVIGRRGLSPADLALFGAGTEKFTWDDGPNHKGYLRYWQAFAPGSSAPTITVDVFNNNQGQRTNTAQTLTIAGYPELSRSFAQTYYLFGGVGTIRYRDYVDGTNETVTQAVYDACLLPSRITMTAPFLQDLAIQTRNVAGVVTKRRTDTTGTMPFVESNWTYDKLGRIASQVVQKGPGATQVVRQDLSYFGNDDPKTLTHSLGTAPKQFNYGYDLRHQLTSVASTTAGYFTANYAYGAGGRFERASEVQTINPPPAGTEVQPRNVRYVYGGTDPEQVTALTNVGNGQTYASYTYDAAGNQLTRSYPATHKSWAYVYDGKDQLRRATKKLNGVVQGSEEYWYDQDGQRIAIVKRDAAGAKSELIWFTGDTEAHYDAAGAVTHVYSHLSMGTPVARIDRTGDATIAVEYQFHGLASNTLAAVDQRGAVNASFSYAPYGEIVEATNPGGATSGVTVHRRRMNDKYEDQLASLAYYGARYFDKTLLNWTQSDPLYRFEPDSAWINPRRAALYTISLSNPLRYVDPDGRSPAAAAEVFWPFEELARRLAAEGPHGSAAGGLIITVGAVVTAAVAVATSDLGEAIFKCFVCEVLEQARAEQAAAVAAAAAAIVAASKAAVAATAAMTAEEPNPYRTPGRPYRDRPRSDPEEIPYKPGTNPEGEPDLPGQPYRGPKLKSTSQGDIPRKEFRLNEPALPLPPEPYFEGLWGLEVNPEGPLARPMPVTR